MAKHEIVTCDRCGANTPGIRPNGLTGHWNWLQFSDYDHGTVDLCNDCYGVVRKAVQHALRSKRNNG